MDSIDIGIECDGFTVTIGTTRYHVDQEMDESDVKSLRDAFLHANRMSPVPVNVEEVY